MGLRNSLCWYINEKTTDNLNINEFVDTYGDWDKLIKEVTDFINTCIPPHQLVNIDFYEESHPNVPVNGFTKIYATVVHSAGANPQSYVEKKTESIPTELFSIAKFTANCDDSNPNTPYDEACSHMLHHGCEEGHIVSSFNVSDKDDEANEVGAINIVVFSW